MRNFIFSCPIGVILLTLGLNCTFFTGQEKQAIRLVQAISMPQVNWRLDHMDEDVKGKHDFPDIQILS